MQIDPSPQLFSQQRYIHQLQDEIHTIRTANEQLKSQLQQVTQQRDDFANVQQQDPIRIILNGLNDHSFSASLNSSQEILERRIHTYQQKVLLLQQEVRELRHCLNHKDTQILQINKQLISLRHKENFIENQNKKLLLENQSLKSHKDQLIQTVENYNSKWQKLATEINQAKIQFAQTTSRNTQELLKCQQGLDQLKNSWLRAAKFVANDGEWKVNEEPGKIQQLTQKLKLQSQIMEELGRELDNRNDQIAQIYKNKNKNPETNPFDTYQHSLNNMIHSVKQRQRHYTDLLKKYQSIAQNYKQCIKQKEILQIQYAKLKESYEEISAKQKENMKLRRELDRARQDFAKSQQINHQILFQCEATIKENDHFLELMRNIYGSQVFEHKMQEEQQKYEKRKRERVSRDLWANTTELIEMNQKLKQKLYKKC